MTAAHTLTASEADGLQQLAATFLVLTPQTPRSYQSRYLQQSFNALSVSPYCQRKAEKPRHKESFLIQTAWWWKKEK